MNRQLRMAHQPSQFSASALPVRLYYLGRGRIARPESSYRRGNLSGGATMADEDKGRPISPLDKRSVSPLAPNNSNATVDGASDALSKLAASTSAGHRAYSAAQDAKSRE